MIDIDFQLSQSLGRTTLDAAAAGWMIFDYITQIDNKIDYSFRGSGIAFGGARPFCVLESRPKYIDCKLTPPPLEEGQTLAGHSWTFRLTSMADITPVLQQQITQAAAGQLLIA